MSTHLDISSKSINRLGQAKLAFENGYRAPEDGKTALVFGGAGAKILWEAGAAQAYLDTGADYNYVIGTSSGAIVAAALHAGQLDDLKAFCLEVKNKDIYKETPWKIFSKEVCYLDNSPLRKTLKSIINFDKIRAKSLGGKFCMVNVCNLERWEDQTIILEPLMPNDVMVEAIVQSAAVPFAFPYQNGVVDGGIVDNYPLFDAIAKNVDRVVLFATSTKDPRPVKGWKSLFGAVSSLMFYNQLMVAMRSLEIYKHETEVILVQVEKPIPGGLLDFDGLGTKEERQAKIDEGYKVAMKALMGRE